MAAVAAEAARRAAQEALDRELMPPPAPIVTRRDVLEREERLVPKSSPVVARRSSRLLEQILGDLNEARRERKLADAEMYEDELYRKLVSQCASADIMPTSVQEKYELLTDLLQRWRECGARGTAFYSALEQEYRNVFERVSFEFDDPAQQMTVDLDL